MMKMIERVSGPKSLISGYPLLTICSNKYDACELGAYCGYTNNISIALGFDPGL